MRAPVSSRRSYDVDTPDRRACVGQDKMKAATDSSKSAAAWFSLHQPMTLVALSEQEGQNLNLFLLHGFEFIRIDAERLHDRGRHLLV